MNPNDDMQDPLANRLAEIPLKRRPPPETLLYECGYAAGLAAGSHRLRPRVWQGAAMIALLLAGGLLGRMSVPAGSPDIPEGIAVEEPAESVPSTGENLVVDSRDTIPGNLTKPSPMGEQRVLYAAMSWEGFQRLEQQPMASLDGVPEVAPSAPLTMGSGKRP